MNCFHLTILFLLGILSGTNSLWAQSLHFKQFDVDNGLPSNETYRVYEDSKGFIWIGSDHGAARYNGYEFEYYNTNTGLTDNTVLEFVEDRQERIWLVTLAGGLCYYDYKKQTAQAHPLNKQIKTILNGNYIQDLLVDAKGNLHFSIHRPTDSFPKIYSLSQDQRSLRIDSLPNWEQPLQTLTQIDSNNYLIWGRMHYSSTEHPDTSWNFRATDDLRYITLGPIASASHLHLQDHKILIFGFRRLAIINNGKIEQESYIPNASGYCVTAYQDKDKNLWIATRNGALLYPLSDLSQPPLRIMEGYAINSISSDKEGNYWFATSYDGVIFVPYLGVRKYQLGNSAKGSGRTIRLLEVEKAVWAFTFFGEIYKINDAGSQQINFPSANNQYSYDVQRLSDGSILSTSGIQFNPKTKEANWNLAMKYFQFSGKTFQEMPSGRLLVGTSSGLAEVREDSVFRLAYNKRVNAIQPQTANEYWLGTVEGLVHYQREKDRFELMGQQNPLLKARILDIEKSPNGTLFLATRGAGLVIKQKDRVFRIAHKEGLVSDFARCLYLENDSVVWVGTNQGLNKLVFPDATLQGKPFISPYTTADGLLSNKVYDILASPSFIWVATEKGVVRLNASRQRGNLAPPPLYFSRVRINGKDTLTAKHYELKYVQRNLRFDFFGIRFRDAGNLTYRYRLLGQSSDSSWTITRNRSAEFNHLSAGKYVFQLAVRGENGIWTSDYSEISFSIAPHFLETWWFWTILGLLLLLILTLLLRYIAQKNRMEKLHLDAEQKALRSQMNPHFIFNAMNSILFFIHKNDKKAATDYLHQFASLIRNVLNNSEHDTILLAKELETLQAFLNLEKQRLNSGEYQHDFTILADDSSLQKNWYIPPMLIQPLAENAILHGLAPKEGNRKLVIEFTTENENLIIRVWDNGIGRQAAQAIKERRVGKNHKSTGLKVIENRLRTLSYLYKKQLTLEFIDLYQAGLPTGTIALLTIPAIRNPKSPNDV